MHFIGGILKQKATFESDNREFHVDQLTDIVRDMSEGIERFCPLVLKIDDFNSTV